MSHYSLMAYLIFLPCTCQCLLAPGLLMYFVFCLALACRHWDYTLFFFFCVISLFIFFSFDLVWLAVLCLALGPRLLAHVCIGWVRCAFRALALCADGENELTLMRAGIYAARGASGEPQQGGLVGRRAEPVGSLRCESSSRGAGCAPYLLTCAQ